MNVGEAKVDQVWNAEIEQAMRQCSHCGAQTVQWRLDAESGQVKTVPTSACGECGAALGSDA